MGSESKEVFKLPSEKVVVKFIPRKIGMAVNVEDNHIIAGGMLDKAVKKFSAPLKRTGGGVVNVLTNAEKEYLEKETGTNLSTYGDFWTTFQVPLYKDSAMNVFDLSDPIDYISVQLLKKCKDAIAPSWKERNDKLSYQFVITQTDEELKEKKKGYDNKKEAFKIYGRIEDDREKLIGVLKLLSNKPIAETTSLEWLQANVEEYIDTMPSRFVEIMQDSSFDIKVLINKAVDKRVIIKKSNKYSTNDGLDLCRQGETASFENAVKYLEDPKNQEVKSIIEAKLNS